MGMRSLFGQRTPPRVVWSALILPALVALVALALRTAIPQANGDEGASAAGRPGRIVTIAPNSAEIICALGACDSIVGVSKFCVYPVRLRGVTRVGGLFDADLEKIIALRPDLVVLRGRSDAVERLCSELQIPIYRDRTEALPDVETCIFELGRLLAREKEAAALVESFRGRLDAIRKRVAGRPRPRVLLTVSRQPGRLANLLTAGKGTFLDEMLTIAGGTNAFGHLDAAYPQVSTEAIIAHRPEVIIELLPELKLTDALKRQMLAQWRAFKSLPAVVSGKVFFLTDDHCLIPSLRYVEIIDKVSRLLHSETDVEPH